MDDTILSQCGTFIALRLSNGTDQIRVQASLPDNLSGVVDSLPILRTGEPSSLVKPRVSPFDAAWLFLQRQSALKAAIRRSRKHGPPSGRRGDYEQLVAAWRSQNPQWKPPNDDGANDGANNGS